MPITKVEVLGLRNDPLFHTARHAAKFLETERKRDFDVTCTDLNELDWQMAKTEHKQLQPHASTFEEDVLVKVDGKVLDSVESLLHTAHNAGYESPDDVDFEKEALDFETAYRANSGHDFVYFDLTHGDQELGRIVFELFSNKLPKTCENFKAICVGDHKSKNKTYEGKPLTYKDTLLHRIQKYGWVQGGDIFTGAGDHGESIYGETFADESFSVNHSKRGILAMANNGLHTNSSQFFIAFRALEWMNTRYVAFGQVYRGSAVLAAVEACETFNQRPLKPLKITACGLFDEP
ncbi:hypothetical protein PTSG_12788 [Salpingoeca rosetta]|uniref:Peptidyl-prolyl cis-trans isomerase n=1 Tax=Salpingoeca rosetta (strain ATCC 50818 / BSB-021) TaxID=946362 RepID=F2UKL9_SALR5|nr:uncharacterized protein PTSG_12788 [Salpingoeca rosetta]EGD77668.1 hypothetical protein PTSG_12788 [Salpingoeca rosetta]|eukprot:XP_004990144.1 hypothetical protein PTSG_12788 [Salpingoeca rosetta]